MMADHDDRRRELAQIHIAKKELGLDDDTYRAALWAIGRVASAADLNAEGRRQLLGHFKRCGFKPRKSGVKVQKNVGGWGWVNHAAADRQPMLRKIAVMLREDGREKAYADAIAKKMHGVDLVEFCAPDQLHGVVSAMVRDQQRRAGRAVA